MTYILQSDIEGFMSRTQLIQCTDDEKTGEIDTDKITKAIEDAESEVNGYLGKRYVVPIAPPVPNLVQKLSTDIAVWNVWRRRQRAPENVRQAYEDAIKRLEKIAAGEIVLDVETLPPASTLTGGEVFTAKRKFTRHKMRGF